MAPLTAEVLIFLRPSPSPSPCPSPRVHGSTTNPVSSSQDMLRPALWNNCHITITSHPLSNALSLSLARRIQDSHVKQSKGLCLGLSLIARNAIDHAGL